MADAPVGRLHRRPTPPGETPYRVHALSAADAGWRYVGFTVYRLAPGEEVERAADGQEVAAVVLEGTLSATVGGTSYASVGSRESVFDGPAAPLFLAAPGTPLAFRAETPATLVLADAPGGEVHSTRLIEPRDILVEQRGSGDTARRIHHLLGPKAEAGRLILFEVYTPGGNWSSYPPHKHDVDDPPRECQLEELYYYRFARPTGWAFQRVYSDDHSLDAAFTPGDGDVVLVPRGYHVVGMPFGYDGYYLNVMAGPLRAWHFTLDPDHAWLMDWDPAAPR